MLFRSANGRDGIPAELFQILKDDAVKVLHSIYQQIWKTQQGHRSEERRVGKVDPQKRVLCLAQVFLRCGTAFANGVSVSLPPK